MRIRIPWPATGTVTKVSRGLGMAVGTYLLCLAVLESVRACLSCSDSVLTPDVVGWLQDNVPTFDNWANAWSGGYFRVVCRALSRDLVPLIATACVYHWLCSRKLRTVTQCRRCKAVLRGLTAPLCPACGQAI